MIEIAKQGNDSDDVFLNRRENLAVYFQGTVNGILDGRVSSLLVGPGAKQEIFMIQSGEKNVEKFRVYLFHAENKVGGFQFGQDKFS